MTPERLLATILLAVYSILPGGSYAQDDCVAGSFGCGHAQMHPQYKDWQQKNGGSCCNNQDCRPIRAKQDWNGNWEIYIPEAKTWIPVPQNALQQPDLFHDGRSHACTANPASYVGDSGYGGIYSLPIYCFSPAQLKM